MRTSISSLAMIALLASAGAATAQQAGDWTLGFGIGSVNPQSSTGVLAGEASTIDNDIRPTITVEYFIRDNLGIELLAATPFEHTISLAGLGDVGTATHLPPTVSLNYHFANDSAITPFVGAGVNYTAFLDVDAMGALAGQVLDIDNSFGLALQAGIDYAVSDRSAIRFNVRWMDIDADVHLDGAYIGTAEIDPMVYGISYVLRF
ncbi:MULTISPECIES: OmpW/AlkL family protein [Paracoccaceae]|uniref:OmpW/AlkL family protein n=1 Tax=Rhodobacterales TaxID=204455 RepID=UPI001B21654D|nr:OmpW family outer membrane protein [Boseongicola sp. H5]MBO6602925.1 OmpW family protein [Roseicyclus sp.]MBO6625190.1 OmpW family protein [Roseicyclus sp.]MBO6923994.1 OmpW family protein [Roseicyclus sp.]